jgi:ubiquinone/menaquinone biosynthesis C-methylase UbiE
MADEAAQMNTKSHWEHIYKTRSSREVSWFQPHADQSLALIRSVPHDDPCRIIDVGGGASTLVDDLVDLGNFDVTVLDISSAALDVARQRMARRASSARWLIGDVTRMQLPEHAYDVWHDRAVFHFMTSAEQRAAYVSQVRRAVRPGGHVIVAAFGPAGPVECSGLPVIRYAPDELHAQFGDAFELVDHVAEAHRTPADTVQQFVYCHCVMQ